MTLAMLAMASLYPSAERGRPMGLLGAVYSLSTLVGPPIPPDPLHHDLIPKEKP